MACSYNALKAEVLAQRELMTEWFQTLMIEIRDAKAELVELIKANTFNVGEQPSTTNQPLTAQQSLIAEPISASAFLESINSPLHYSDAVSDSNLVCLPPKQTRNPETEQSHEPIFKNELILEKIEPAAEELSVEFSITQNERSNETLCEQSHSELNRWYSVQSANLSATVTNKQLKSVSAEKPFACDKCDYKSAKKSYLIRHSCTHKDENPFSCRLCPKKFKRKESLREHLMTHNGENPLKCELCDFRCIKHLDLVRHKRRHLGEKKPFACDQCAYTVNNRSDLKRHQMVHTGEKPFACDQCDFRTSQKGNLANHKRTHTGEKPFQCDLCNYRAFSKPVLWYHKKTKHQPQV